MKKIISAVLVLSVFLTQMCIISVSAKSDYAGHWAEEYITKLTEQKIVSGDENGNINPDNNITRAEFVKIINKKFNFTEKTTENFPDVSIDQWYAEEFKIAKKQGYVKGDEDGKANPDSFITRAEVSVIIARVLELKDDISKATKFTDDSEIPDWAKESIYQLNVKGYINGYPDGSFKAENTITRAESFTVISKVETTNKAPETTEKPQEPTTPEKPEEDKKEENKTDKPEKPSAGGSTGGGGGGGGSIGGGGGSAGGGSSKPVDYTSQNTTIVNKLTLAKTELTTSIELFTPVEQDIINIVIDVLDDVIADKAKYLITTQKIYKEYNSDVLYAFSLYSDLDASGRSSFVSKISQLDTETFNFLEEFFGVDFSEIEEELKSE